MEVSIPTERAYWLAWSQITGVGPVLLQRLSQRFGSLEAAWQADQAELLPVNGVGEQLLQAIVLGRRRIQPNEFLAKHSQTNPQFWTPADPDYPRLLREIADPPAVLYYRGQIDLAENQGLTPLVAIVGTREPTDYGKRWTRRLTRTLVSKGFTIVSGLAQGIDSHAHAACLEAGGRTLAVMGTGVNVVYPPQNQELYQQISEQGLILSEYPAGTRPDRGHFPRRNRIVAGMCRATLIMEAPTKSGALITANLANEYGRDVFVLPGSLDNPQAIGCLGLVSRGAQLILNEGLLLEHLGAMPQLDPVPVSGSSPNQLDLLSPQALSAPPAQPTPDLSPDLQTVFTAVGIACQTLNQASAPFDLIVEQANLSPGETSAILLQLELLGLVTQQPGMRYQVE